MRSAMFQAAMLALILCAGCGPGPKSSKKAESVVVPAAPIVVPASEAQVKSLAAKVDGVDITLQAVKSAADGALTTSQSVQTNTEVTNAKLDEQASRLQNVDANVDALLKLLESMRDTLVAPAAAVPQKAAPSKPAPRAAPDSAKDDRNTADSSGPIRFFGQPINVAEWLRRPVPEVEINGDVDAHLRYHGFTGDFSGLTREEKIRLHSAAHNLPEKSVTRERSVVKSMAPAAPAGDCANGRCAIQYESRRDLKQRIRSRK